MNMSPWVFDLFDWLRAVNIGLAIIAVGLMVANWRDFPYLPRAVRLQGIGTAIIIVAILTSAIYQIVVDGEPSPQTPISTAGLGLVVVGLAQHQRRPRPPID